MNEDWEILEKPCEACGGRCVVKETFYTFPAVYRMTCDRCRLTVDRVGKGYIKVITLEEAIAARPWLAGWIPTQAEIDEQRKKAAEHNSKSKSP